MSRVEAETTVGPAGVAEAVASIRSFAGPLSGLWPHLLRCLAAQVGSRRGLLMRHTGAARWTIVAQLGTGAVDGGDAPMAEVEVLCNECVDSWHAIRYGSRSMLALRVDLGTDSEVTVAVLFAGAKGEFRVVPAELRLVADSVAWLLRDRVLEQARGDVQRLAAVLDLLVLLNREDRFVAAAMALCNELASRLDCDRVSLGWLKGRYVKVQAISHTETFKGRMEEVTAVERLMEEAFDQDDEVTWPPLPEAACVAREHEQYVRGRQVAHVCTVPLRLHDDGVGALCCERDARPFSVADVALMRLAADQASPRLAELRRRDRWVGARLWTWTREKAGVVLGIRHTGAKLAAVAVCALVLGVFFGGTEFRVEGDFTIRSRQVLHIPAPFEGYLEDVRVEPGDVVAPGDLLLALDTRDLLLEEAAAIAERDRQLREVEKSRADGALADMRIATARAREASVRLERIRHRLSQAELTAPFAAVVVKGDLRERVGAPLQQGDALLTLARLDKLYAEVHVPERDIDYVGGESHGHVAFASRPHLALPVAVERLEPAAETMKDGNVFVARCAFAGEIPSWCRPGMTGVCKLDAGRRSWAWLCSHRTIDFLHMHLWW